MAAETLATDSHQNILFSILLFGKRFGGTYPSRLTIVTHDFKLPRFRDVHMPACRWRGDKVQFIGIDPPESVAPRRGLDEGEAKSGYGLWKEDWYGVHDALALKREARGWQANHSVEQVDAAYLAMEGKDENQEQREIINLLMRWEGSSDHKTMFPGRLPWGHRDGISCKYLKALMKVTDP